MNLDNEYRKFTDGNFGLNDVSMGEPYTWKSGKSREGLVSVFGRLSYNFKERYLFTGTLRADGSSKFAKGNQWGIFPSASAAWRISEEAFLEDVDFLDNLKLRVGYGTAGIIISIITCMLQAMDLDIMVLMEVITLLMYRDLHLVILT